MTDIGEQIVAAYFREVYGCQVVDLDVRLGGQDEIDVVGVNLQSMTVYVAEVTTRIATGLKYKNLDKDPHEQI